MRQVRARYADPLDEIWLGAARRVGYRVVRTGDVYAGTDGRGAIQVGTADTLDGDDCLAQIILHELCHALVEGEAAWTRADWGLDNQTERHTWKEHACLRLQAALLAPLGLQRVLAPTTEHRAFYDTLGDDPLAGAGEDEAVAVRLGMQRAGRAPFAPHLTAALAATAGVARAVAPFTAEGSLIGLYADPPPRHPVGFVARAGGSCGTCAWLYVGGKGQAVERCRQADGARVERAWAACARWEAARELDCQTCGACCREAYQSVTVGARDPVVARHPGLVVQREGYLELRREGPRCAALTRDDQRRWSCTIYEDRPKPCRDLARGGAHCLTARRRVGLSG